MTAGLPARDFEEIRLAEALEGGRCPICDARQEGAWTALRGLAREGASDVGFRAELDRGVAFCQPHAVGLARMELLQTSSQLATGILLEAILRRKLAALRKLPGDGTARARAVTEVATPNCPVCRRAAEAADGAVRRLLALTAGSAWSEALGTGELCLQDFLALLRAAAEGPRDVQARWAPIADAQQRRLESLRKLVADFAHNSTADRRHLITPEQQAAAQAAIRLFGGTPDRDRTR